MRFEMYSWFTALASEDLLLMLIPRLNELACCWWDIFGYLIPVYFSYQSLSMKYQYHITLSVTPCFYPNQKKNMHRISNFAKVQRSA